MIAVDTNVIVRFLTNDDRDQAIRARSLLRGNRVFLAKTVLLECEWVLRSGYGLPAEAIAAAFRELLGLPDIVVEDASAIVRAMDWYSLGLDFADALHLASSVGAESFASFDKSLARRLKATDHPPVVVEP